MKENVNGPKLKLGFHRFYTYIFLPLSLALAVTLAIGRLEALKHFRLDTIMDGLDSLRLVYPFILVFMDFLALVGLVGFRRFGRKWTLFSSTIKVLFAGLFVAEASFTRIAPVELCYYAVLGFFGLHAYFSYVKRSIWFPAGGRSWKGTRAFHQELNKPVVLPIDEEVKEEAPAEPVEEVVEEKPEEEVPVAFSERTLLGEQPGTKKKVSAVPGMFSPVIPLLVKSMELTVLDGMTLVDITVVSRAAFEISREEWLFNGKYPFVSNVFITPGSTTVVRTQVNMETDRLKAEILSLEDPDGNKNEYQRELVPYWPVPEKKALKSLSDDERFPWFLRKYVASTSINATYIAAENINGKAITCPVCGNPMAKEERYCPVCGLSATERKLFEKEMVLNSFKAGLEN